jgi:hypothetical protein
MSTEPTEDERNRLVMDRHRAGQIHPPASVPTPAELIGMFNPVSRRFCYVDETRKIKEEPGYCVPVYAIRNYEATINKADDLQRENAALVADRDEAIKAHGVVWNAVRRAAHAFRWLGIEKDHPELAEDRQAILQAEKLTPKWSTSWVIMTTTEADALRSANAVAIDALKELSRPTPLTPYLDSEGTKWLEFIHYQDLQRAAKTGLDNVLSRQKAGGA